MLTGASAQVKVSSYTVVKVLCALLALVLNKKSQRYIGGSNCILYPSGGHIRVKAQSKNKGKKG
jgi:hypothetical protein